MRYKKELGMVFDTIRFLEIYFNHDEILNNYRNRNFSTDEVFKYYNIILNNIQSSEININPQLIDFFDLNDNEKSFLTGLFYENIASMYSINNLISIFEDNNIIISGLIDYYVDNANQQMKDYFIGNHAKDVTIEQILRLNVNEKLKISLILTLSDYDNIKRELIDIILIIYDNINKILTKNNDITDFTFEEIYLNKVKDIIKCDNFSNTVYSVSLLHCYTFKCFGFEKRFMILGYLSKDALDALNKNDKFLHVTPKSISNIIIDDMKIAMINIIREYKKICGADIIKVLPHTYSNATVYRILNNLMAEKVIYISGRDNKNIFYSINTSYFENAHIVLYNFLLSYIRESNCLYRINDMQKIIEAELSKKEYQILHSKIHELNTKCSDKNINDSTKVSLYGELVNTLIDIRKYENNMFFIKFGLIY